MEQEGSQDIAAKRCSFSVLVGKRIYARSGRKSARRPISRVLSRPLAGPWMTIPLGRPLPNASRDLPGWLRRKRRLPHRSPGRPAIPMRSCSRWGLPCHRRYRRRGALLPHPFTLATRGFHRGPAVCSLWHFPWGRPRRALPGTVFPWSPDFPRTRRRRHARGHPAVWRVERLRGGRQESTNPGAPLSAHSAAMLAQQVIALQTELQRPKPL